MQAEVDRVNGRPVLRLEKRGGWSGGKRAVYDLPLTDEQARAVQAHMGAAQ